MTILGTPDKAAVTLSSASLIFCDLSFIYFSSSLDAVTVPLSTAAFIQAASASCLAASSASSFSELSHDAAILSAKACTTLSLSGPLATFSQSI